VKRAGNLYPRVVALSNLVTAARLASRGKRYRPDVAQFNLDLESELVALQHDLVKHTYRPGPYRTFWVQDPKRRLISAAPFRDRVVHHALCQVIEPVFERTFVFDSYACRTGKGNHRALEQFVRGCQRHRYVLMGDVRKFFPSIDHEVIVGLVHRRIKMVDVGADLLRRLLDETHQSLKPHGGLLPKRMAQLPPPGEGIMVLCSPTCEPMNQRSGREES
jgi:hypothetical protein